MIEPRWDAPSSTLWLGHRPLRTRAEGGLVRFDARRGALVLEGRFPEAGTTSGVTLSLTHDLGQPRRVHVPHLTPEEGFVAGDQIFRAPAVVVADRALALAFVVDVDDVARVRDCRAFLDYDDRARRVTLGAGDYREVDHVLYRREPAEGRGQSVALSLFVLASARPADIRDPFAMASRFLWRRYGAPLHRRGGSQRAPLERSMELVTRWAFTKEGWGDEVWQSLSLDGREAGAPVFIIDVSRHPSVPVEERRWREPRAIWNQAWFSTQRCANGLLRHARRRASKDLERRARLMTEIALAAPERGGLFPSIVAPASEDGGWERVVWRSSDRRPSGVSEHATHLLDAAFTSRRLLEWHELTGEPRALAKARRYALGAMERQRKDGSFPGWIEPDGAVPRELAAGPESAMTVTLLLELAARGDAERPRLLTAAMRGLSYLEGVVAAGRWEDFETYYSCAPWGRERYLGRRIPRNGVFKANTLAMHDCAEAFLYASRVTADPRLLRLARRCASELSLYQAVWDPPFLPAPAHGGFGVMNADCEWNDARQSLFVPLYFRLYEATGDPEMLERGVAAVRASFTMLYGPDDPIIRAAYERKFPFFGPESFGFMMENQGHSGADPIGTFTIFTWGNGSALATAAWTLDRYGQVFVDLARRRAFGVDGCDAEWDGARVLITDHHERPSLEVGFSDGRRAMITLDRGRAALDPR